MSINRQRPAKTASNQDKHEAQLPPVTFSPEKLAELLNEITALRQETAELKAKAVVQAMAPNGTSRSAQNELLCIRAFKKQGFGMVIPNVDVFTFNKWIEKGFRPVEGSKSVRVANLRLFHKSQVRPLTKEDLKAIAKQKADHAKRQQQAKTSASVHQLNPQ